MNKQSRSSRRQGEGRRRATSLWCVNRHPDALIAFDSSVLNCAAQQLLLGSTLSPCPDTCLQRDDGPH